jgi:AraC-like DNA-binding protein
LKSTRHPLVPEFDQDGLCLLESMHALDFRMGWTRHPFLKVITALRGRGVVETKSGERLSSYGLSAGKVIAIFPDTLHRLLDEPGEPLLIYILCVGGAFPFSTGIPARRGVHLVEDLVQTGRALQALREISSLSGKTAGSKTGNRLLRCGLTATLLARLLEGSSADGSARSSPDSPARMRSFISCLRQDFFQSRSIDQAAEELRMSRRRFTQLFAQFAGESYLRHIHRLRMEYACRILKEKKLSPLTVAFQVGYEDASTFYRAFNKHTGMSPARWAKCADRKQRGR